jgi:hypothetical protein
MRAWLILILAILIGTSPSRGQAQLPAPANGPFYRYIILIDGSSVMGRRKKATAETVGRLIYNGFDGQIQPNDIYGIWTFQNEIDATAFPAQRWSPNNRQIFAAQAARYITDFKYRKRSNLDVAVKEMIRVTKISKEITVFLISDGREVIYGTPYDLDISTTYVLHRQELATAKQPFVTAIAARDGRMQAWAVEAGDGEVTVPRIPEKDPPPAPPSTKPKPEVKTPAQKTAPPKESVTAKRTTPPPPIAKKAETPRTQTQTPKANQAPRLPPQTKPTVVKITLPPNKGEPAKVSPSLDPPPKPREPAKIMTPRANNNTSRANPRSAQLKRSQAPSRQFPGTAPASTPASTPPAGTIAKKPTPAPPLVSAPPLSPSPTGSTTNSPPAMAARTSKTLPGPTTNSAPSPPSIAAVKTAPLPATNTTSTIDNTPGSSAKEPPPSPTIPTAAPQTGIILPTAQPNSPTRYLFLALALLSITGIMIFLALRRGRTPSQASLISQSLDREQN